MGLFDKFKAGLTKTRQLLKTDVRDLFKKRGGSSTMRFWKNFMPG